MLASCYEGIGELDKARTEYQAVLELTPDHQETIDALERLGA